MVENTVLFPITNDYVFTKVFTKNPHLAVELIQIITGKTVSNITINQQEVKNPKIDSLSSRYDLFIVTSQKEMFDIEMQRQNQRNLAKRSRYYLAVNDVDSLKKKDNAGNKLTYNDLPYSNIIFICTFDPFHQKAQRYEAVERLYIYDKGSTIDVTKKAKYQPDYVKIFLNISDDVVIHNIQDERLNDFIHYMKTGAANDTFTKELQIEVEDVNRRDRGALMTRELELIEVKNETKAETTKEIRHIERQDALKEWITSLNNHNIPFDEILKEIHASTRYNDCSNETIKDVYDKA